MSPQTVRNDKGQFVGKRLEEPAVFLSDFEEYIATMQPGEMEGDPGKRLYFIDGKYKTSDMEEYKFLKRKEKETKTDNYGKIKCVYDPLDEEEEEE